MGEIALTELVRYLDDYLDVENVPDYPGAANGLQVENGGSVRKLVVCTDACQATIDAAAERGADFLIVHHGLFWGDGLRPLTGRNYRRVQRLIEQDIALYSAHLPLDLHPEVGNNVQLAGAIGLSSPSPFGEYEGREIGVHGELELGRDELVRRLSEKLGSEPHVIAAGPPRTRRVGVITGGASSFIAAAHAAGLDTFITGEGPHHTHFDAEEWRLNVIYAGHYATETLGVRALARHLEKKFGLDWEFVDHPTGL